MILAIDIGGTNTRAVIYNKNEKDIVARTKFLTIKESANENFLKIVDFIKDFENIDSISISFPGVCLNGSKTFSALVNLPKWNYFPYYDFIMKNTNIKKIFIENDANLMALSNHKYFKQSSSSITQFFTISTGLGAGTIINNKIFKGTSGWAQEIANLPTSWNKESGKNLGEGSVEYFASGSGLICRAKKAKLNIEQTKELFEKYNKNEKVALIVNEGIEALANLIAIYSSIISPNLFVFDGSVARNNKWYIEKAIKLSKVRMFKEQFNSTKFKFSELGDDSALIGAYLLAKENN